MIVFNNPLRNYLSIDNLPKQEKIMLGKSKKQEFRFEVQTLNKICTMNYFVDKYGELVSEFVMGREIEIKKVNVKDPNDVRIHRSARFERSMNGSYDDPNYVAVPPLTPYTTIGEGEKLSQSRKRFYSPAERKADKARRALDREMRERRYQERLRQEQLANEPPLSQTLRQKPRCTYCQAVVLDKVSKSKEMKTETTLCEACCNKVVKTRRKEWIYFLVVMLIMIIPTLILFSE